MTPTPSPSSNHARTARVEQHRHENLHAAKLLNNARQLAQERDGYSSHDTRQKMCHELEQRSGGLIAYDWQLDVAEALLLGLDCSVVAGTGAGKTMPFILPLLVRNTKIVVIISPLNALEEDQAARFNQLGLSAVAVNGETYNSTLHKDIEGLKYNVVITSPEMCLQHDNFRRLLNSPTVSTNICAIIIDEAHCISQWGDKFRPLYAELGTLRSFVSATTPFLVTSATLPPATLASVRQVMHMPRDTTYHVNLGTDRPNIAWFMRTMKGGKSDLDSLSFLLLDPNIDDALQELTQSMVFFDDINLAMDAMKWLRARLPPRMRGMVAVYHSRRSTRSKKKVLRRFRLGKIKILLTTEAAGMGCDQPHIEQVVQFMVPANLSVWMQRAGRGGRNRSITARAVLLVQPTVFQERKLKTSTFTDAANNDTTVYRKAVEEGLREWIEAKGCRREVARGYFGDGSPVKDPSGICCDNCLRKSNPEHPFLLTVSTAIQDDASSQELNQNGKRVHMESAITAGPASRRDEHLHGARKLLTSWRLETYEAQYGQRPWGIQCLLPDAILTCSSSEPSPS